MSSITTQQCKPKPIDTPKEFAFVLIKDRSVIGFPLSSPLMTGTSSTRKKEIVSELLELPSSGNKIRVVGTSYNNGSLRASYGSSIHRQVRCTNISFETYGVVQNLTIADTSILRFGLLALGIELKLLMENFPEFYRIGARIRDIEIDIQNLETPALLMDFGRVSPHYWSTQIYSLNQTIESKLFGTTVKGDLGIFIWGERISGSNYLSGVDGEDGPSVCELLTGKIKNDVDFISWVNRKIRNSERMLARISAFMGRKKSEVDSENLLVVYD
jgi:hypothetical protein